MLLLAALTIGLHEPPPVVARESLAVHWLCSVTASGTASCLSLMYTPRLLRVVDRVVLAERLEAHGGALVDCGSGSWTGMPGGVGAGTGASRDMPNPATGGRLQEMLEGCASKVGMTLPARGTPDFLDVSQHAKTPGGLAKCGTMGIDPSLASGTGIRGIAELYASDRSAAVSKAATHVLFYPNEFKTVASMTAEFRREAKELESAAILHDKTAAANDASAAAAAAKGDQASANSATHAAAEQRETAAELRKGANELKRAADHADELHGGGSSGKGGTSGDGGRPSTTEGTCDEAMRAFQAFTEECDRTNWQSYSCTAFLAKASGCVDPALINPGPDGDFTCTGYKSFESEAALKQALILACEAKVRTAPGEAVGCTRAVESGAPTATLLTSTCWNPKAGGIDENCPMGDAKVAVATPLPWGDRRAQLEVMRRALHLPPLPQVASGPTVGPRPGGVKMTVPVGATAGAMVKGTAAAGVPSTPTAPPARPPIPPR
jgi:hypothetical protein